MKQFFKDLLDAWIEARTRAVKARQIDGHWY